MPPIPAGQTSPYGPRKRAEADARQSRVPAPQPHRQQDRGSTDDPPGPLRVLTFEDLRPEKGISFSRYWLRQLIAQKKFPQPISLGGKRRAWLAHEVDQWIRERAAERDSAAA
jgi:predicted DNA-binding transcriptional regulator AlpA